MIIDIFLYNNEEDILDIRLNVHSFVDRFVLIESPYTLTNQPKELNYKKIKNGPRFIKFKDKIEHLVIPKMPGNDAWENEHYSRNYGMNSEIIKKAGPEDVILYSDCDEIVDPKSAEDIRDRDGHFRLEQREFFYYINCRNKKCSYRGPAFLRKKNLKTIQEIRRPNPEIEKWSPWGIEPINAGGWHLTYMGGIDKIIEKIGSYAHTEYDTDYYKDKQRIGNRIDSMMDLFKGDERMFYLIPPEDIEIEYVRNNMDKFKHLIKQEGGVAESWHRRTV